MTYNSGKTQALHIDFRSDKVTPQQMHICSLKDKIRLGMPKTIKIFSKRQVLISKTKKVSKTIKVTCFFHRC